MGHGARPPHPSSRLGNPDPALRWIWLAAGPGTKPFASFHLLQPPHERELRRGAALTLDEFSLWLNLDPNDYWSREGRISIDAVILFGGILAVGAWGAPFFRGLQLMWKKRKVFRRWEIGRPESPIRRVRLLRPRRVRRLPTHTSPK